MAEERKEPSNVEVFVRDLIKLGGVFNVNEDGYVVEKSDPEKFVTTKVKDQPKMIMVLKDSIGDHDALVINPLNENISETSDLKWLYAMMNVGLVMRINELASYLNRVINETEEGVYDTDSIEFASKFKNFDDKTLTHWNLITKKKDEFMPVWYNRKTKEGFFRCSLYDSDIQTQFPGISQKSWKAMIGFISGILGLSSDPDRAVHQLKEIFTVKSNIVSVPRLESILNIYEKIYERINKYLDLVDKDDPDFVVDITTLGHHIENLTEYHKKAKWFVPTTTSTVPTAPAGKTSTIPNIVVSQTPMIQPAQESVIPMHPIGKAVSYAGPDSSGQGIQYAGGGIQYAGSSGIQYANPQANTFQYAQPYVQGRGGIPTGVTTGCSPSGGIPVTPMNHSGRGIPVY